MEFTIAVAIVTGFVIGVLVTLGLAALAGAPRDLEDTPAKKPEFL